jgi:hypothetical protein
MSHNKKEKNKKSVHKYIFTYVFEENPTNALVIKHVAY